MSGGIAEMLKELADRYPKPAELPPVHTVAPFPKCSNCHDFDVVNEGDWCQQCTKEKEQGYEILSMLGRLANGAEFQKGVLFHAVKFGSFKAMCGAKPGRRSVGWTFDPQSHGREVTCPRCVKKIK